MQMQKCLETSSAPHVYAGNVFLDTDFNINKTVETSDGKISLEVGIPLCFSWISFRQSGLREQVAALHKECSNSEEM